MSNVRIYCSINTLLNLGLERVSSDWDGPISLNKIKLVMNSLWSEIMRDKERVFIWDFWVSECVYFWNFRKRRCSLCIFHHYYSWAITKLNFLDFLVILILRAHILSRSYSDHIWLSSNIANYSMMIISTLLSQLWINLTIMLSRSYLSQLHLWSQSYNRTYNTRAPTPTPYHNSWLFRFLRSCTFEHSFRIHHISHSDPIYALFNILHTFLEYIWLDSWFKWLHSHLSSKDWFEFGLGKREERRAILFIN